jgi:hypothetical protein
MKKTIAGFVLPAMLIPLLLVTASHASTAGVAGLETPGFPKIKGWKLEVSDKVYTPDNLWDLINGAAESYLSYDFIDLHLADYSGKGGTVIHAEAYRHSSVENAFGIYSTERSPGYKFVQAGTQGYLEEGVLNFLTGEYYIKLYSTGSGKKVQDALMKISVEIADNLGSESGWPELLGIFPPEGKIPHADHYVRENFIGFNFLHSAYTAEYEGGYKLFIIKGKGREDILEMAKAYLAFTKQSIDPAATSSFTISDRYNGDIPVVLEGPFMVGILEGKDKPVAKKNLETLVKNLPVE